MQKHRPYGAADTYALKVPAAHFYVEIVDKVPLPRSGGGVGGAEPSAASGGCSEAEHP